LKQGGAAVGVEGVALVGIGVKSCGTGVVVGSGSVARGFVGGRNGVGVDEGAQDVRNQREIKMNTDARNGNLSISMFIVDAPTSG